MTDFSANRQIIQTRFNSDTAMPPTVMMQFADRLVTYETFMTDLTARLARVIKSDAADPEYVSQRTAYSIFGRKNVDRWRRTGKVKPSKRPGKVEYCMADLRLLQRTEQDYTNSKPITTITGRSV